MSDKGLVELLDDFVASQEALFSALGKPWAADLVEDHRGQPWDDVGGPHWHDPKYGDQEAESHEASISKDGMTLFYCENNGRTFWAVFSDKDRDEDRFF